jgi:hypothetical protein
LTVLIILKVESMEQAINWYRSASLEQRKEFLFEIGAGLLDGHNDLLYLSIHDPHRDELLYPKNNEN